MRREAPDPKLVLKVTPPRFPRTAQTRARLNLDRIEFRDRSIIEVIAPAGFGKTTLLGQWRREELNAGSLVAWLTLDQHDKGVRFGQGLAYALRMATGRPGFDRVIAQSARQDDEGLGILTDCLAEITFLAAETRIFLDEVQSAPPDMLAEALPYLLLNAPPNLRIVLASRRPLSLPVADIVARGLCLTVSADRLRFSPAETTAVIGSRFGTRIGPDDCLRLHDKIGGWPLGLQLAIASIEKNVNLTNSIDALKTISSDFEQYFLDRFVSALEPSTLDFLERVSLLDALEPNLCGAVTERKDALELIVALRETLPIFSEGLGSDWMRLHPLARDFLRGRLAQRSSETIRALHQRAAAWYAENRMNEEAANHELAAGNTGNAFALIGNSLHDLMTSGHQARVLDWLALIPAGDADRQPNFLIGAAWALTLSDRHAEAAALIDELDANPAATSGDRFEGTLIRCAAHYFADEVDSAAQLLEPWDLACPTESLHRNGIYANCRGTMMLYDGKPEQARQVIMAAQRNWPRDVDAVRGWGEWVIGFSYLWEGQIQLAIEALQASLQKNEEVLGRRAGQSSMFAATLSEALWHAGRIEEAAGMLADRLDVIERLASPEAIAMGYRTAARIAETDGNQSRALDLLDHLQALGVARSVPRFTVVALAEQVRMHALSGRADTGRSTLARLEELIASLRPTAGGKLLPLLELRCAMAQAYAALAMQDWQAMEAALAAPREIVERLKRGRERIDVMLLSALVQHHRGDDGRPLVEEAMSLASTYGVRVTLRETNPKLFAWAQRPSIGPGAVDRRAPPAAAPSGPSASPPHSLPRTSGLLTTKEDEILQLLEKNLSNKHIAAALGISSETVKWHIKNLFEKLNAGSRKHVVDRARMLGILGNPG